MSQEIVLFHSALGRRPAVLAFAERLRGAGHRVHTPDLFDGEVFADMDAGARKRDTVGIPGLIGRAQAAVQALPADLVYAGFSMGSAAAQVLAASRPGARGLILMHGALPLEAIGAEAWPPTVPVQIHYARGDAGVDPGSVAALEQSVRQAGAGIATHVYDRGGHLFADPDWPDYDAGSAQQMMDRVLTFLSGLGAR